jgi:hypothetical protein
MTDAPDLTPEQDAVRRLLAEARHDGSPPPEVVARLDDALASLVAERGDAPLTGAPGHRAASSVVPSVVDLGARRRRTAGIALLAAAAVVVGGVAVGQVLPRMAGSDDAGSVAGGDTATSESRGLGAQEDSGGGSDGGSSDAQLGPESLKSTAPVPDAAYPTLSSLAGDLDDDLLDLRARDSARTAEPGDASALGGCDVPGIGRGRRIVAQVDGQVGLVVFRRPHGATQQADLYVCSSPDPVRTLSLPAP